MTPAARVVMNGKDVTTAWKSVLVSLTVTDEAGLKADQMTVVFDNREIFSAPPIDADVQVWLGYEPKPIYMGRYRVSSWRKHGRPKTLTVIARAASFTADIKMRKKRSWHDTTVSAIVTQVAKDHGLTAVIDQDIGARSIPHIDQQTESDMAFLTRLAKRQGATFKLGDGQILFAAKGSTKRPDGGAKPIITIKETDCTSWDGGHEARGDYKSVVTHYVDKGSGKHVQVRAGTGKPQHRDPRQYGSRAEAQAAAKAQLDDLNRGKTTATIDLVGNPDLYAEALIDLQGFDPDVDGEYLAKTVTHTLTTGGYTTSVDLEDKTDDTVSTSDDSGE